MIHQSGQKQNLEFKSGFLKKIVYFIVKSFFVTNIFTLPHQYGLYPEECVLTGIEARPRGIKPR